MANGTKHASKSLLIDAIKKRVFKNETFETSSTDIQLNDCDIVETLWDRGASIYEELLDYNELLTLIGDGELFPGRLYSVPYQGVHLIPGTSDLNINSLQYVLTEETFVVRATAVNEIDPWAKSLSHPDDLILWDVDNNIAEDGLTTRSGKVIYRKDTKNNLSTYYDFRSVYFRRGALELGTSIPSWSSGLDWSRNQLVLFGSNLKRAKKDYVADTDLSNYRYQIVGPADTGEKWVWQDNATFLGDTLPRVSTTDRLGFDVTSKNIELGKVDQNNGYNNIVLDNCSDIKLGNGSYDSHIVNSSKLDIGLVLNSYLGNVTKTTSKCINSSYMRSCTNCDVKNLSNDAVYNSTNTTIGENSSENNLTTISNVNIDNDFRYNSIENITDVNISPNFTYNWGINVSDCVFGSGVYNNILSEVKNSFFKNNISSCNFSGNAIIYSYCDFITVGSGCSNITCPSDSTISKVFFGESVSNIVLSNGASLSNVDFGNGVTNVTINNSSIVRSTIANSCSLLVLTDSNIVSSTISNDVSNLILTNSVINSTSIGPGCSVVTLTDSTISNSTYDFSSNLTSTDSTIDQCKIGPNSDLITLVNGANLTNVIFQPGSESIVFDGTANPIFKDCTLTSTDANKIFDNISVLLNSVSALDVNVVANISTIDMLNRSEHLFNITLSADLTVDMLKIPSNIELTFVFQQTDVAPHDVTFTNDNGATVDKIVTIPASSDSYVVIKRIVVGSIDKLILVKQETI